MKRSPAYCQGSLTPEGEPHLECSNGVDETGQRTGRCYQFPYEGYGYQGYGQCAGLKSHPGLTYLLAYVLVLTDLLTHSRGNTLGGTDLHLDHGKLPNEFETVIDDYCRQRIRARASPADDYKVGISVPKDFLARLFGCNNLTWCASKR